MDHRDAEFEQVAEAQRTTKAEARRQEGGAPDPGIEVPARSYPDPTGVADLGVDEPVVSPQLEDDRPPGTAPDPTGMFAGETAADRRDEEAVRRVLEERFPESRGAWKEGGRVPSPEDRAAEGDPAPGTSRSNGPPEGEPVCGACGGPIEVDDIFCPRCGTSLVAG